MDNAEFGFILDDPEETTTELVENKRFGATLPSTFLNLLYEIVSEDDGNTLKEQSLTVNADDVTLDETDTLACTPAPIAIFSNDENAVLEKGAVLNVILHSYTFRPMLI